MKKYFIIVVVIVLIIVVGVVYWRFKYVFKPIAEPNQVACTQEAKVCPDGSSVGRQGPNCEFAACPPSAISEMTKTDWEKYLPSIKSLFTKRFPNEQVEEGSRSMEILKAFKISGINFSLVTLGTGGASTDEEILVALIDNQIKIVDVVNSDNTTQTIFLSGASVMHGDEIQIFPSKDLIFVANWANSIDRSRSCHLKAYLWNNAEESFIFDQNNSDQFQKAYCQALQ
ncbi:MAG: hypothetical protein WC640_03780 [Candidatus Paceibacterota bacterium]|jgi:hypothetical protein